MSNGTQVAKITVCYPKATVNSYAKL